ncbi:hypothetical protein AB0G13_27145, partial [Micromonospora sp. NPDC023633]
MLVLVQAESGLRGLERLFDTNDKSVVSPYDGSVLGLPFAVAVGHGGRAMAPELEHMPARPSVGKDLFWPADFARAFGSRPASATPLHGVVLCGADFTASRIEVLTDVDQDERRIVLERDMTDFGDAMIPATAEDRPYAGRRTAIASGRVVGDALGPATGKSMDHDPRYRERRAGSGRLPESRVMTMRVKAVLLDLDGTLLDHKSAAEKAFLAACLQWLPDLDEEARYEAHTEWQRLEAVH